MAWYWHRVVELLERAGHEALAVELPGDDKKADFDEYADIVARAAGGRASTILVAQSLAGFTAPLVCERSAISMLVFVNAMIPRPGERAGDWWENTGAVGARLAAARDGGYSAEFDVQTYFLHDVPPDILRTAPAPRQQADIVFSQPCRFRRWPEVPTRVIASANDRFFPPEFQKRVASERLNTEVDIIPGGHLVALSNPHAVSDRLLHYEAGDAECK
jgi:pimeloyl-ACP methyl ester carboxylesterase